MKTDQLFEKAKQAVAEKHGFSDFREYSYNVFWRTGSADSANQEAAEWMCNEAVKADRTEILKTCVEDMFLKEPNWDSADFFPVIDKSKVRMLPLPFPQQPDER